MATKTKIRLEDQGQDFLEFIVNENGIIEKTSPFQGAVWNGAYIPVDSPDTAVGELCPIHHPLHINYGFLKYRIESIEAIETP